MKIAELRNFHADSQSAAPMRGTDAQDIAVSDARPHWRRFLWRYVAVAAALLFLLVFIWLARAWSDAKNQVFADRIRVVTVTRGNFVRDVAGQGTVIAAISPTLFAVAPGTISYVVRPGDTVRKGQKLATLDSPALRNDYDKERATLDGMTAALSRQEIEIRRQILGSQQKSDLAGVTIHAAERELKRSEDAWGKKVISERDYQRAVDDVACVIDVTDRGSGLTDNVLRDALLPFFSTKASGTGLGLTLCREIIEAHGGRLSLTNRPDGGGAVTVWLPQPVTR